jgi:hypothetical protein
MSCEKLSFYQLFAAEAGNTQLLEPCLGRSQDLSFLENGIRPAEETQLLSAFCVRPGLLSFWNRAWGARRTSAF